MMRVCVVGCGQSGLASIKSCLEQGLDVVAYEQDDSIGKFITLLPTTKNCLNIKKQVSKTCQVIK